MYLYNILVARRNSYIVQQRKCLRQVSRQHVCTEFKIATKKKRKIMTINCIAYSYSFIQLEVYCTLKIE